MWSDFRVGVRTLRRSPVFACAAIATLALGIAANTAIFSLFYQILLRSLPVPAPEQLVLLHSDPPWLPGGMSADNNETVFSYPMYQGLSQGAPLFQGLAARSGATVEVTLGGASDRVQAEVVSGNFFDVLRLHPAAGRLLMASDDNRDSPNAVAVLSYSYWVEHFGGSAAALNRTIRINGQPFLIVGIAPEKFNGFLSADNPALYVPIHMKSVVSPGFGDLDKPGNQWINVFGRVKDGVNVARARASLQSPWKALLRQQTGELNIKDKSHQARVLMKTLELRSAAQGINQLEDRWRKPLTALLAMVGLLLLIACANVANLLLARAATRERENAIRIAIGAGRWQLIRHRLTESLLLAVAGGIIGMALAFALLRALLAILPEDLAGPWLAARLDPAVLMFSLLLVLATVLLFGLSPAVVSSSLDPMPALKDQNNAASASGGHVRWRRFLVAGQLALSLALLVAAGLFAKTLVELLSHDAGFKPERLVTFSVDPGLSGYSLERARQVYRDLAARLLELPDAEAVSTAEFGPLSGNEAMTNVTVEGFTSRADDDSGADINTIGPSYFRTLGTPLIAGREFTLADREGAPRVAVVNEAFAAHFLPGVNPLGKHMETGAGRPLDTEIVGVVKNTNTLSLREAQKPAYYTAFEQSYANAKRIRPASFFVRSRTDAATLERAVRITVRAIAPDLPVFDLKTMTERVNDSIYTERLSAIVAVLFGGLAILLAAVGIYGVVAYSVARRTAEIGLRLALGAMPAQVLGLIMREVFLLAAVGVLIGTPAAYALARIMSSQLYGVKALNVEIFCGAMAAIIASAALAGVIPAYRASILDPKDALRHE